MLIKYCQPKKNTIYTRKLATLQLDCLGIHVTKKMTVTPLSSKELFGLMWALP